VPFELDLHHGKAVVSVVPFLMRRVRFPWTPVVPFVSSLWELNLRTYVVHRGVPGIFFFTLESGHRLGNFIARRFFYLPYRYSRIDCRPASNEYRLSAGSSRYDLRLTAHANPESMDAGFQRWVTERYSLFVRVGDAAIRGDVSHAPWEVRNARVGEWSGNFAESFGVNLPGTPDSAYLANPLKVRFAPFRRVL
ncbi:MAG: DUF2071 domain-containing protein, partial [Proteobacteria bacterium]|nr:DUF2071 domain-containing protein [Pseudomonadota bacterium]